MASGPGIDSFVEVGKLCWKLYSQVYKVSRDAPEELRGLNQELGNLHNTIQLLVGELEDLDSTLSQSGDVRISTVRRIILQSEETLKKMQRLSERYVELQTPADARDKRRVLRILWDQLKYSRELHNINDLRSKLMLHNSQLALILQGAQNSSLERIEKQNAQTDKKLDELKQILTSDRNARDQPMLTAPLDPNTQIELTNIFLQKAEVDNHPWASIGIDNWLQAGRWWLMKAQSQFYSKPQNYDDSTAYNQRYANLLKACWILTDIIAIHPQRTHLGSSNDRRTYHIQRLAQDAISKLKALSTTVPRLEDLQACYLDIWSPCPPKSLAPTSLFSTDQTEFIWQTRDGEIIFQRFTEYQANRSLPSVECILIAEIPHGGRQINFVAQHILGHDIYRYENKCISNRGGRFPNYAVPFDKDRFRLLYDEDIKILDLFSQSLEIFKDFQFEHIDVSMAYPGAVLGVFSFKFHSWHNFIKPLSQIKQEIQTRNDTLRSSLLQPVADRAVAYIEKYSKCFPNNPDTIFLKQGHCCPWMLICWFCDTSEEFLGLLNTFGISSTKSHPIEICLIKTAVCRMDVEFEQKSISYMGSATDSTTEDIDLIARGVSGADAKLLRTVLTLAKKNIPEGHRREILKLACIHLRWDHMGVLLSWFDVDLKFISQGIAWLLVYHGQQELQIFIGLLHSRGVYPFKKGDCTLELPDIYESIMVGCAEIIRKRSPQKLEIFLEALQGLGIPIGASGFATCEPRYQLAIFPALISPDASVLKLLFEKGLVSTHMEQITLIKRYSYLSSSSETIKGESYPPVDMPHWPLYFAIGFGCDSNILEYLCRAGAGLEQIQNESSGEQPKMLRKIRSMLRVQDARENLLTIRQELYRLIIAGGRRIPIATEFTIANTKYASSAKVWRVIGCHMYEDGYQHDHSPNIYGIFKYDGKDTPPLTWPVSLQTQESWNKWRLEVIDILQRANEGLI